MLTQRFEAALIYAHTKHETQLRKGTSIPYMAHLLSVAALLWRRSDCGSAIKSPRSSRDVPTHGPSQNPSGGPGKNSTSTI